MSLILPEAVIDGLIAQVKEAIPSASTENAAHLARALFEVADHPFNDLPPETQLRLMLVPLEAVVCISMPNVDSTETTMGFDDITVAVNPNGTPEQMVKRFEVYNRLTALLDKAPNVVANSSPSTTH